MLTGDEQPTAGEARLNSFSLSDDPQNFLADIGYCPQFDAIIDHMTGREMFALFCRLRGIPTHNVSNETEKWIEFLGKRKSIQLGNDLTRVFLSRLNTSESIIWGGLGKVTKMTYINRSNLSKLTNITPTR